MNEPPLEILIIDDDEVDFLHLRDMLEATGIPHRLEWLQDCGQGLDRLADNHHDLCLLDERLKARSGLDLLVAAHELGCRVPMIMLNSCDGQPDCEARAIAAGAHAAFDRRRLLPEVLERTLRHVMAHTRVIRALERTQGELEERTSELERLKYTLDQHAIVSIADAAGTITYVNEKFCEISGFSRAELIGANHRIVKSGLHPQAFYDEMWATIVMGRVWEGVVCNRSKDGHLYWVRSTIVPFPDEHGLPYQYVSVRTDVTALQQANERIRILAQAVESSLDGIAIADSQQPDFPLVYVNPAFEAMTGYSLAELLGRTCGFLQGEDAEQPGLREIKAALDEGRAGRSLLHSWRKDGTDFWIEMVVSPVRDERGQLTHFVGVAADVTERKQAEDALRNSEDRLRRSQAYANIGTWDWNIQSGELFWSERIGPLFGYDQLVETTYENFLKAVHPEDRQAVIDAVNACVERGEKYDIEHRCVWPDGSVRWMLERGDVVRDADGRPLHMLGVVQDITDRKLAQLALQQKESLLREAQEIARLGNWSLDVASGKLDWSDEIYRIFGRAPREFEPSYEQFFSVVHPDDADAIRRSEAAAFQAGQPHSIDHRIVLPGGEVRWVHEEAHADLGADGRAVRLSGTVQDITERKMAEERLRASEASLAHAQSLAHLGNWEYDLVTGDIAWSDEIYRIFGQDAAAYRPNIHSFYELVHPEDVAMVREEEQRVLAEGRGEVVHRIIRPDGTERYVRLLAETLQDRHGRPSRMLGSVQDITELKQRENEMILARDEAERANRAKSDFLSSMSHELRTPMNAILGFAQLMEMGSSLDDSDRENVREILKAGRHLLDLINEVLDLAKIEAGKVDLSIEPVVCCDVVGESVALVRPLAERYGVTLAENFQLACPTHFLADRTRFKQVLINLLSNAIKYNRPQGRVTLRMRQGLMGGVRLEVEDTGQGIPADRLDELFQPFQRLGNSLSGVEGTGIGLVISKRLIEGMGGWIGVESLEGEGSTFWVELPRAGMQPPPSRDTPKATEQALLQIAEPAADSARATLLYVEDNPANMRLMQHLISRRPAWRLLMAETPQQGIEQALACRPDVIMLDINLPEMDGYALRRLLQEDPRTADIPVVAVSANAMPHDIERSLSAGFLGHLTKPIDVQGFYRLLDEVLSSPRRP